MWRTSIVVKFELEFTKFNSGQGQMRMAFLWVRFHILDVTTSSQSDFLSEVWCGGHQRLSVT